MTSTKPDATVTPPYPPWSTFRGFFTTLKNTAIPPQVDSSVMSKMSGSAKQQVRSALVFFGLIDDAGNVQRELRDLVNASDSDAWRNAWAEVFYDRYSTLVSELDLDTATLKQLADRFRDRGGVSGSVLRKSLRFYLDALAATGSTFSPHFKVRGLSVIAGDKRPAAKPSVRKTTNDSEKSAAPQTPRGSGAGMEVGPDDFVIKLPGRDAVVIPLPPGLTDPEWKYISDQVVGYMNLRRLKK